jgi:hypothetical protein
MLWKILRILLRKQKFSQRRKFLRNEISPIFRHSGKRKNPFFVPSLETGDSERKRKEEAQGIPYTPATYLSRSIQPYLRRIRNIYRHGTVFKRLLLKRISMSLLNILCLGLVVKNVRIGKLYEYESVGHVQWTGTKKISYPEDFLFSRTRLKFYKT